MLYYFLNLLLAFICLPYLYFAVRKLRKEIPVLPNAQDLTGTIAQNGADSLSVLFLGESAIAGVGVASNYDGLAGQVSMNLAQQYNKTITWEVIAHTGYDAQMVIDTLLPKLGDEPYDLVLIQLCVNDTLKLVPPVIYSVRIEKIINHLKNKYPKSKILFVNNAPIRDMSFPYLVKFILGNIMDEYGKVIEHLVVQHQDLYFINQKLKYSDWQRRYPNKSREEFFSDGVHPSAFTFARWSEDICDFIKAKEILNFKK